MDKLLISTSLIKSTRFQTCVDMDTWRYGVSQTSSKNKAVLRITNVTHEARLFFVWVRDLFCDTENSLRREEGGCTTYCILSNVQCTYRGKSWWKQTLLYINECQQPRVLGRSTDNPPLPLSMDWKNDVALHPGLFGLNKNTVIVSGPSRDVHHQVLQGKNVDILPEAKFINLVQKPTD